MKKILYIIYQIIIGLPIALVITILTALITILGGLLGNSLFWGYYPGMIWGRVICRIFLLPIKVTGRENIDKNQSYIIVSNHQGIFDTFLIYGFIGINFKWLIKKELERLLFIGPACKMAGHIFIDRRSHKESQESLKIASNILKNGTSVTIFPEGTRSADGTMGKFKKGAFRLAEELQLPLLPITINGSYFVMSKNDKIINRHKMSITIHAPIPAKGRDYKSEVDVLEHIKASSAEAFRVIFEGLKKS
ncbi:MAG TPA: lysophospholipid acyltransferase family protein [Bacteroidaceae bacterium]|nr:lysophospholipid acyltransferase family protein [Bacteroidaceae bacterium]